MRMLLQAGEVTVLNEDRGVSWRASLPRAYRSQMWRCPPSKVMAIFSGVARKTTWIR